MYKGNVILTLQISHWGLFFITQSNRVFRFVHLPWVSKYQSCHENRGGGINWPMLIYAGKNKFKIGSVPFHPDVQCKWLNSPPSCYCTCDHELANECARCGEKNLQLRNNRTRRTAFKGKARGKQQTWDSRLHFLEIKSTKMRIVQTTSDLLMPTQNFSIWHESCRQQATNIG